MLLSDKLRVIFKLSFLSTLSATVDNSVSFPQVTLNKPLKQHLYSHNNVFRSFLGRMNIQK